MYVYLLRYFDMVIRTGVSVRAGLVSVIYQKALKLSNKSRQERSIGSITNHITTDTSKIQLQCTFMHNLWSSPVRIVIGMYMLASSPLKGAVFAGVALLILLIPLQIKVMGRVAALMKKTFKEADKRLKVTSEIMSGMQIIKYYAW